ncbi:MAG TPA: SDR family oxidoreductase [Phycisphaerales bacterium]|nr:SDR family oxidoreductase [Phycisphaerales bacterium]
MAEPGSSSPTSDRVALITGAGSGIGRATALVLAEHGYALGLAGRARDRLEETAGLVLAAGGPEPAVLIADVGAPANARALVLETARRLGRLDALINNAGVAPLEPIDGHTPEVLDETFRVNALGPANSIAAAWPIFVRQGGGVIVNVSTMGTLDPFPGFFGYASSKASVNLMARSCALEGAAHGIRAFAVAPGATETPMFRRLFPAYPAGDTMDPARVARVIWRCVAGELDGRNGQVIEVAPGG